MMYISKRSLQQHTLMHRCLNGLFISFVVVLSGCENIRFYDGSTGGHNTLFYADTTNEPPQIAETVQATVESTISITDTAISEPNMEQSTEQKVEQDAPDGVQDNDTDQTMLVAEHKPVVNIAVKQSTSKEYLPQQVEHQTPEKIDDEIDLVSKKIALVSKEIDLLSKKLESKDKEKDEYLVAEVNALTASNPTAAGQKQAIENHTDYNMDYEKRTIKLMDKQLKHAMKTAQYELLSWQFSTQKAENEHADCHLSSPTIQLDSSHYTTQFWLSIEEDHLVVNATTHIDPVHPLVGIYLDNGVFERFSTEHHSHYVSWDGSISRLLKENKNIKLVISGNDLQNEVQLAAINLALLSKIYPKYQSCTKRSLG